MGFQEKDSEKEISIYDINWECCQVQQPEGGRGREKLNYDTLAGPQAALELNAPKGVSQIWGKGTRSLYYTLTRG